MTIEATVDYTDGALAHGIPTELARLRALEAAWDPFTKERLASLAIRPDASCLEIGAGTGSIAHWLAARHVNRQVIATDIDIRFIAPAGNLQVVQHDVRSDAFPAGSFDLIHVRAVLSHLAQRDEIIDRIKTWLKPAGVLLVEDLDISVVDTTPYPALRSATQALEQALARSMGSDLRWVRGLPGVMHEAGFESIAMQAMPLIVGGGAITEGFIRSSFLQLRTAFAAAAPDLAAVIDGALQLLDQPGFADIGGIGVAVSGRRPL
jgi:SAM-dependent methyltransferase